eukprot:tig00000605_g2482.t1
MEESEEQSAAGAAAGLAPVPLPVVVQLDQLVSALGALHVEEEAEVELAASSAGSSPSAPAPDPLSPTRDTATGIAMRAALLGGGGGSRGARRGGGGLGRGGAPRLGGGAGRGGAGLADPRILATPLFGSFSGRRRLHALFAALRASTPDATGTRLVRAVVRALAEALLEPLPAAGEGAAPFREADVGRLLELAANLVETCTTWTNRADPHHFLLEPRLADRLALCAADLALPFAASRGPLHARALLLRANIHRAYDRAGPAVELYYEAWSDLRRKGLVPSDEEAALIPRLANLLFETCQPRTGLFVASSAYLPPGAAGEERTVAEFHLAQLAMTAQRWQKDQAGAERHGRRCLEIAEGLEPRSCSVLKLRVLVELMTIANYRLQPISLMSYGNQALKIASSLHDPSLADLDLLAYYRYTKLFAPVEPLIKTMKLCVAVAKRAESAGASPILAHGLFQLGELHLAAGDARAAARCFAAALSALEPFSALYPPEHPRRARLEWALAELRADRLPPPAFPPPEPVQAFAAPAASPGSPGSPSQPPSPSSSSRTFAGTFLARRADPTCSPIPSDPSSAPSPLRSPREHRAPSNPSFAASPSPSRSQLQQEPAKRRSGRPRRQRSPSSDDPNLRGSMRKPPPPILPRPDPSELAPVPCIPVFLSPFTVPAAVPVTAGVHAGGVAAGDRELPADMYILPIAPGTHLELDANGAPAGSDLDLELQLQPGPPGPPPLAASRPISIVAFTSLPGL